MVVRRGPRSVGGRREKKLYALSIIVYRLRHRHVQYGMCPVLSPRKSTCFSSINGHATYVSVRRTVEWSHMHSLLFDQSVSRRRDEHPHHLFELSSGGDGGGHGGGGGIEQNRPCRQQ